MQSMQNIQIVLVETSHPGNIGAVARAMKTMRLTNLCLVNPKLFPHAEATAMAAGADDILANAKIVGSLEEAIAAANLVFGSSARLRAFPLEILDPRTAASKIATTNQATQIALVFGRENNGLNNDELSQCHFHIHVATDPSFSSLNLAAAVQIVAYEINQAMQHSLAPVSTLEDLATANDLAMFYQHLQETLVKIKFFDMSNPKKLMPRLRRLFNRALLEKTEVNILRGMLTAITRNLRNE